MTAATADRRRSFSRVIYDIAHLLESADAPEDRLRRALTLMRWSVPFDVCALLEAAPLWPRRLLVEPEAPVEDQVALGAELDRILGDLLAERAREQAGARPVRPSAAQGTLAVPIVALGEPVGLLFVRRAAGAYSEGHLRALAIVAGQVAAYLSMVRIHEEGQEHARELDEARRAAIAADRAKDELLAVLSQKLKDPVTATLAWAHILVAARADPEGPALAVAAIERNARALAKLIDDIQRLPCVASAELRLDLRAGEPVRKLKAAIEGPRPPAEATMLAAAPRPAPGWLNVDARQLGPVVSSAVASATQVSPKGGCVAVFLDRDAAEPAPSAPSAPSPGPTLEGIHVLFVDDDVDIREAFLWVLEYYGAQVTTAASAAEALAAFDRARPDVLLCDLSMPGDNGYDLMGQLAARDVSVPAAAVTAFGELADPGRALAAGFRMQLSKPIDALLLVAAVLELAGRQAPLRQAEPR